MVENHTGPAFNDQNNNINDLLQPKANWHQMHAEKIAEGNLTPNVEEIAKGDLTYLDNCPSNPDVSKDGS